jgi:hypothetical protein
MVSISGRAGICTKQSCILLFEPHLYSPLPINRKYQYYRETHLSFVEIDEKEWLNPSWQIAYDLIG